MLVEPKHASTVGHKRCAAFLPTRHDQMTHAFAVSRVNTNVYLTRVLANDTVKVTSKYCTHSVYHHTCTPLFGCLIICLLLAVHFTIVTNYKIHRVAALEKKLEVLSQALKEKEMLKAQNDGEFGPELLTTPSSMGSNGLENRIDANLTPNITSAQREHLTQHSGVIYKDIDNVRRKMAKLWKLMSKNSAARLQNLRSGQRMKSASLETDVVSTNVLSRETAQMRFDLYKNDFNRKFPMVDFMEYPLLDDMRRHRPILFLTMMSITSVVIEGKDKVEQSLTLYNLCMDCLIYETMILGNKTLELLKCLLLVNAFINTPETHQHQKTHLITHLCTTMAIDMGLGGVNIEPQHSAGIRYDRILRPYLLINPHTYECRKLWLCVYISSINLSMIMKRPVYLMWSKYTEECCELLERPETSQYDKKIAKVARINHLHEEITSSLQSEDPKIPPNFNDPRTRCLVRYFQHKLNQVAASPEGEFSVSDTALNVVQIYLHESALYTSLNKSYGRVPFSEFSLALGTMEITVHSAQAIGWCYSSSTQCLSLLSKLDIMDLTMMPIFCFTRICICAATLLKLRTLYLTTPTFAQICTVEQEALEPIDIIIQKLEQVIEKYPGAHFAPNFCFVLHVLICHFDRQLYTFFNSSDKLQTREASAPLMKLSSQMSKKTVDAARATVKSTNGSSNVQPHANGSTSPSHLAPPQQPMSLGSPLDILSSVASSHNLKLPALNTQLAVESSVGANLGIMAGSQEAGESETPDSTISTEIPAWLMGDDFWKDLVPGIEALSGFELF